MYVRFYHRTAKEMLINSNFKNIRVENKRHTSARELDFGINQRFPNRISTANVAIFVITP